MIGSNIIRKAETVSTSDDAKNAAGDSPEGTVIVANEQSGGRGKPGNTWFSPPGVGLYFSVILKPYKSPAELADFTRLCAKAIINSLEQICGLKAELKLPNDLLVSGKKICGILTEKTSLGLVIGVGVNVNTLEFPPDLQATSVALETGQPADREKLFQKILFNLDNEYVKFLKSGL